uniref:Uncharacterized protein n=1 Tax=Sipha flava TaxID=143950 RepID=A0A2S2QRM2_9HEMI
MAQQQKDLTVNYKTLPKFSVVDFEFALYDDLLYLISGAISHSDSVENDVTKFEGIPIRIDKDGKTMNMTRREQSKVLSFFRRILAPKKLAQFKAFKMEMDNGFKLCYTNLTRNIIANHFNFENRNNIILVWNGSTDVIILERLRIWNAVVNLEAYDVYNNGDFFLRLTFLRTKQLIAQVPLGKFYKNGRLLSLTEAHDIICWDSHEITYLHDPRVDVILTKCLFNYLVNEETFEKILKKTLVLAESS